MKFILILFCMFALITSGMGTINCNPDGNCSGDGEPGPRTRCGNCFSCTYKNCCHFIYTYSFICCDIEGWRHPGYQKYLCRT
uniref:Uncharacterized protein n=2 Tax=Meloidogyne TaxID=189290 RepID=A0A6V7UNV5_MELEN|nr:unnamed protein product [Meloidogyne enterolobii]